MYCDRLGSSKLERLASFLTDRAANLPLRRKHVSRCSSEADRAGLQQNDWRFLLENENTTVLPGDLLDQYQTGYDPFPLKCFVCLK